MTLEALYYISQIVAVAAVLASLIFVGIQIRQNTEQAKRNEDCLLYTSPSPRDQRGSRMPSSA